MKLSQIARQLGFENLTPQLDPDAAPEITAGYVSDLLSDVLAGAAKDSILVTVQVHLNVIAVAVHAGLAAVIFAANRRPEPPVVDKAVSEKIPLFLSSEPSFEIVGRLYAMGIRGSRA
jgi:hypothetical protein